MKRMNITQLRLEKKSTVQARKVHLLFIIVPHSQRDTYQQSLVHEPLVITRAPRDEGKNELLLWHQYFLTVHQKHKY
jgi:hypothetical protein